MPSGDSLDVNQVSTCDQGVQQYTLASGRNQISCCI